jgi:hypothetical protein
MLQVGCPRCALPDCVPILAVAYSLQEGAAKLLGRDSIRFLLIKSKGKGFPFIIQHVLYETPEEDELGPQLTVKDPVWKES